MRIVAALLAAVAVFLLVQAAFGWREPRRRKEPAKRSGGRVPLVVRLRQAGLGISAARYRLGVSAAAVAVFAVVWAVTSTAPVAVVAAVGVAMLPRAFYRRRRERLLAERVAAWPEAIRDVLSYLAIDNTLHRALLQLSRTGPVALRPVWESYARNAAVLDVVTALEQVRADLADPVSDQVIEAFEAAYERGSHVAVEVLEALAVQVSRDLQLREEIVTSQSEIRSQAAVSVILPFVMLGLLVTINESFARFYSRPAGWVVIGIGVGLAAIGWSMINTLGQLPTEPRVLDHDRSTT